MSESINECTLNNSDTEDFATHFEELRKKLFKEKPETYTTKNLKIRIKKLKLNIKS